MSEARVVFFISVSLVPGLGLVNDQWFIIVVAVN